MMTMAQVIDLMKAPPPDLPAAALGGKFTPAEIKQAKQCYGYHQILCDRIRETYGERTFSRIFFLLGFPPEVDRLSRWCTQINTMAVNGTGPKWMVQMYEAA